MSRAARIAGWAVFVAAWLGVGAIALALLSIRSPLADGTLAPGPEPTAYVVIGLAVTVGAAVAGAVAMTVVELGVRVWRRRRSM